MLCLVGVFCVYFITLESTNPGYDTIGSNGESDAECPEKNVANIPKRRRQVNKVISQYDMCARENIFQFIGQKTGASDQELVSFIRELLDPPSCHILKRVYEISLTPQASVVNNYLKQKVI